MPLRRFDMDLNCSGFPDDDQIGFADERCCIVVLVEHIFKRVRVEIHGIRKVFLKLEQRKLRGLIDNGDFQSIAHISWPFDCARYFAARGDERTRILAEAAENAMVALARKRGWSTSAVLEIFAKAREANYELVAERAKACRSPDGKKAARVSYFVDREEFRIDVRISGPKKVVLFEETVHRDRPTAALCVDFTLGKPFWLSNEQLILPYYQPGNPDHRLVVNLQ